LQTCGEIYGGLLMFDSRHRRRQRHAIQRRIHEAVEFMDYLSKKTSDSGIVPSTQQLIGFTEDVHDYAERILPLEQSGRRKRQNTGLVLPSRPRVDSAQTTNSLATSSFAPRCDSPDVKMAAPVTTPTEGVESILNYCDKCAGTCTQTNLYRETVTPPSPTPSTPTPRPSGV
jgi:hypothetical protein